MISCATTIVVGADFAVAEWVRRHLPEMPEWGPCRAIGIVRHSDLIAGVVYNNFRGTSIEASIASTSPLWCSRRNLAAIFAYPFSQLGVSRLGASTEDTNQPVRAFLCRLGFRPEGVLRHALGQYRDLAVFGMTRAECRWLPQPSRQGNGHVEGRTATGQPTG